jgi:cysteine desulfurase/selenocysteine lyase
MSEPHCDGDICSLGAPAADEQTFPDVRKEFPIFANHPEITFFDNASTSQKPASVIQTITDFYTHSCANAGRASYSLSTKAAQEIEQTRNRIARFLNADSSEIVFTSGSTESLNMVAQCWGLANLKSGDEVMVCFEDHKSTVLPWLNLKDLLARFGVSIKIVPVNIHAEGDYELKSIREQLTARTRLLAITHVHHLYGLDMEVKAIRAIVGENVLISLDASQSVGHRPVDVKDLTVDFLSFSGHKMFAANGVGVLWVATKLHGQLIQHKPGGSTPGQLTNDSFTLANRSLPALLEAGTQNIPAILSLKSAVELIERVGINRIEKHVSELTHRLYDGLKLLPGIEFSPGFGRCGCHTITGYGILSFRFEQTATSDLAFLLDSEKVLVRTGDHCLTNRQQGDDYVRVSLHIYNTEAEIDRLLAVLTANLA